jgi:ABC-2 type transport system permease protein
VIFLTGMFLIPLMGVSPLDITGAPFGVLLTSIVVALCSSSLGILIASIARTEGQVTGISSGLLWVAGLIGGSILPSFMMPDWMNRVARFLPHYWANQAFFGLFFRNESLTDIYLYLLIMLVFTAAFFLVGVWRFKFE